MNLSSHFCVKSVNDDVIEPRKRLVIPNKERSVDTQGIEDTCQFNSDIPSADYSYIGRLGLEIEESLKKGLFGSG